MFMLSLDEIKDMIIFCKQQKVSKLQIGQVNIEMSEYSHIENLSEVEATPKKEETKSSKTLVDTNSEEQKSEDEEMLFWSSNS